MLEMVIVEAVEGRGFQISVLQLAHRLSLEVQQVQCQNLFSSF